MCFVEEGCVVRGHFLDDGYALHVFLRCCWASVAGLVFGVGFFSVFFAYFRTHDPRYVTSHWAHLTNMILSVIWYNIFPAIHRRVSLGFGLPVIVLWFLFVLLRSGEEWW